MGVVGLGSDIQVGVSDCNWHVWIHPGPASRGKEIGMSSNHQYFVIPFENVSEEPPYTVWFATWSRERPVVGPGMAPPMVVGVTTAEELPDGATLLASGSKDPPPPPPPPP